VKFIDQENDIVFIDIHSHILKPALKNTLEAIRTYEGIDVYIDTLDLSRKYQKKWFYNYFISELCKSKIVLEFISNKQSSYNQVIYVFDTSHIVTHSSNKTCDAWFFVNETFHNNYENIKQYERLVSRIKEMLPVNILEENTNWCQIMYYSEDKQSGEYQEFLAKANTLLKKNFSRKLTYEKVRKFCKTYGMTFLDETYFNDVINKQKLSVL